MAPRQKQVKAKAKPAPATSSAQALILAPLMDRRMDETDEQYKARTQLVWATDEPTRLSVESKRLDPSTLTISDIKPKCDNPGARRANERLRHYMALSNVFHRPRTIDPTHPAYITQAAWNSLLFQATAAEDHKKMLMQINNVISNYDMAGRLMDVAGQGVLAGVPCYYCEAHDFNCLIPAQTLIGAKGQELVLKCVCCIIKRGNQKSCNAQRGNNNEQTGAQQAQASDSGAPQDDDASDHSVDVSIDLESAITLPMQASTSQRAKHQTPQPRSSADRVQAGRVSKTRTSDRKSISGKKAISDFPDHISISDQSPLQGKGLQPSTMPRNAPASNQRSSLFTPIQQPVQFQQAAQQSLLDPQTNQAFTGSQHKPRSGLSNLFDEVLPPKSVAKPAVPAVSESQFTALQVSVSENTLHIDALLEDMRQVAAVLKEMGTRLTDNLTASIVPLSDQLEKMAADVDSVKRTQGKLEYILAEHTTAIKDMNNFSKDLSALSKSAHESNTISSTAFAATHRIDRALENMTEDIASLKARKSLTEAELRYILESTVREMFSRIEAVESAVAYSSIKQTPTPQQQPDIVNKDQGNQPEPAGATSAGAEPVSAGATTVGAEPVSAGATTVGAEAVSAGPTTVGAEPESSAADNHTVPYGADDQELNQLVADTMGENTLNGAGS